MEIHINYTGSWRNSFLSDFNGSHKGRKYISSIKGLNDISNYKESPISINTVMGILYRLLGAQQPLYKMSDDDSIIGKLFRKQKISFEDNIQSTSKEIVFLRNGNKSLDPSGYSGLISESFLSDNSLCSVFSPLFISDIELVDVLLNGSAKGYKSSEEFSILEFNNLLNLKSKNVLFFNQKDIKLFFEKKYPKLTSADLGKQKASTKILDFIQEANDEMFTEMKREDIKNIALKYREVFGEDNDLTVTSVPLLAALNFATSEMADSQNESFTSKLKSNNIFKGISANAKTFSGKDFFGAFSNTKILKGNPYSGIIKQKGSRPVDIALTKCDGNLIIKIDCDLEKSKEIENMIELASTTSFYVGKKGLGYIVKIL